jgi:uncharacterized protein YjiS (DUF1127 family)
MAHQRRKQLVSTSMIPILYTLFSSAALLSVNGAVHTGLISGNLLIVALKRWAVAYITWRTTRAIAQLRQLSDQQLKDIGLSRLELSGSMKQARRHAIGGDFARGALS